MAGRETKTTWIEVLPNGTRVKVINSQYVGNVVEISIRGYGHVEYLIGYWHNGERKEVWLSENDFTVSPNADYNRIGFRTEASDGG